jgi:Flp pilus assembly protein TadG
MRIAGFVVDGRGAAAVEFSLVIIPLFLLLFGTIEFGRLLWTRQSMQSLAMSAARCMALPQTQCATAGVYSSDKTINFVVSGASKLGVALAGSNVTPTSGATCGGVSNFSKVTIDYTFNTVAPRFITALASGSALTVSACFPNQT